MSINIELNAEPIELFSFTPDDAYGATLSLTAEWTTLGMLNIVGQKYDTGQFGTFYWIQPFSTSVGDINHSTDTSITVQVLEPLNKITIMYYLLAGYLNKDTGSIEYEPIPDATGAIQRSVDINLSIPLITIHYDLHQSDDYTITQNLNNDLILINNYILRLQTDSNIRQYTIQIATSVNFETIIYSQDIQFNTDDNIGLLSLPTTMNTDKYYYIRCIPNSQVQINPIILDLPFKFAAKTLISDGNEYKQGNVWLYDGLQWRLAENLIYYK